MTFALQPRSLGGDTKWLLSQVGVGLLPTPFEPATAADLAALASTKETAPPDVRRVNALLTSGNNIGGPDGVGHGAALAAEVLTALRLDTAARLMIGDVPSTGRDVAPNPKSVTRFDKTVAAEAEERREVESWLK